MKAMVVHRCGGPEVLKFEDYPEPVTKGKVLLRVSATSVVGDRCIPVGNSGMKTDQRREITRFRDECHIGCGHRIVNSVVQNDWRTPWRPRLKTPSKASKALMISLHFWL